MLTNTKQKTAEDILAMRSAFELVHCFDSLQSMPEVLATIERHCDDGQMPIEELANLIGSDPTLTLKVLQLANSALFGLRGNVGQLDKALQLIGMRRLRDLVITALVSSAINRLNISDEQLDFFWRQSVSRACVAKVLMKRNKGRFDERLNIFALLSDVGHLVMQLTVGKNLQLSYEEALQTGRPLYQVQQNIIGCDQAEVAAALVAVWNLPSIFATVLSTQNTPALPNPHQREVCAVYICNQLADLSGYLPAVDEDLAFALKECNLSEADLIDLVAEAKLQFEDMLQAMFA